MKAEMKPREGFDLGQAEHPLEVHRTKTAPRGEELTA